MTTRLTRLAAEFTDAWATASSSNTAELETLVQSAIAPVQTCLETELALAIKNVEAALTSSFDTWAHSSIKTLNDTVDASIKAIEKKVDALHGSSYGHITKTTLPEFARRLDALEARARPSTPPPANKIDPSNNVTNKTDGVALEENDDDNVDVTTRTRQAWAATRVRNGVDPNPSGPTTAGPPRALYRTGILRNPVVSPYHPLALFFRDHTPLRQTTIPETISGPRSGSRSTTPSAHVTTAEKHPRAVGGAIVSPRHSDCAIHTRSMGASRFDVSHLATPEYHVGMDGTTLLTEDILQDCGYSQIKANVEDVIVYYNDIILVHHKVMEL